MLTPEEAAASLCSLRDPDWRQAAVRRARALDGELAGLAEAFLPMPESAFGSAALLPLSVIARMFGSGKFGPHLQRQQEAGERLDLIARSDRLAVMEALHPRLGTALSRWWADGRTRPYLRGWDRRAFRGPANRPGLTAEHRTNDLAAIVYAVGPFDADPAWLAGWGGHLAADGEEKFGRVAGEVLAAAIDLGGPAGDATFAALLAVGNGEHPTGIMGRHVIVALLDAARPEGWDFIERLLLAAQRQEGLRQAILEAAHEGHPDAFDRLLSLVLEHNLLRFGAAVRAAGVWLGFGAEVSEIPQAEARLRALASYRADEDRRVAALASGDAWEAYVALCAQGMREVYATLQDAGRLMHDPAPDRRAMAVRYLAATDVYSADEMIIAALADDDLRVAALAAQVLDDQVLDEPGVFDALAALAARLPEKARTADAIGIEREPVRLDRARVASLLVTALGDRPLADLLPWLPAMDATGRLHVANKIAFDGELSRRHRAVLFQLLADRSSHVRQSALAALGTVTLAESEAAAVEALLTRSASDLRRGALTLLRSLPPPAARASAERLAASGNKNQREAGAELLGALEGAERGHREQSVKAPLIDRMHGFPEGGLVEFGLFEGGFLQGGRRGPTLGPAEDLRITLVSQDRRSEPITPALVRQPGAFADEVSPRIVTALDDLAHEHRNTRVEVGSWQGSEEALLDDVDFLPSPFARGAGARAAGLSGGMILSEVFGTWWDSRPGDLRHDDERDALRAFVTADLERPAELRPTRWAWIDSLRDLVGRPSLQVRHPRVVHHVLAWLVAERASPAVVDECLEALETSLAMIPAEAYEPEGEAIPSGSGMQAFAISGPAWSDWRHVRHVNPWLELLERLHDTKPDLFGAERIARWYGLMRWVEQPRPDSVVVPVEPGLLAAAYEAGAATRDDVIAAFLRSRSSQFRDLTRRWREPLVARHPGMVEIADHVRERLIDVELSRGDLPTPTSQVVGNVGGTPGADLAVRLLSALGRAPLSRGYIDYSDSKPDVFSRLILVSFPLPADTGDSLARAAHAAGVSEARLIDLAVYAPQWSALVESALGWPGLADGALWLHAHTKDDRWSVDDEIWQSWAAMTAERTPLRADDLMAGAVDAGWFRRAYGTLGAERWAALDKAAKYASAGTGHARARLFAQAMLGQVDEAALVARITSRRHQDAVRALGLLPLPAAGAEREAVVQRRYLLLREFERGSKGFGSQRQASEKAAARIGVENLARAAGYADPQRFIWAVEAGEAGDLATGPVTVTSGDVTLSLSVSDDGIPEMAIARSGRVLSAVPAALRKDEQVAALRARRAALTSQAARVRLALEAAMVAQDPFTDDDLARLGGHPIVRPMLERLLWADEDGQTLRRAGGSATAADAGAVTPRGSLRIAHPADFAAEGTWVRWQEHIVGQEWKQPFKQVFRELYVPTGAEREGGPASHRYDGHQVQPRQAQALFGRRGWLAARESGDVSRVFHRHNLAARVEFDDGFLTAAEAELPTIAGVFFTRPSEYAAQPLDAVPPIVFSEAMRDLDLVVSVAHAGGVDPEASASTTQMRAALIRETARLLKLENISVAGDHVLIDGTLGEYALHLGSGTVHRRPGGAICIIPVGAQHRGRLFLPFADDDPKTAEIVSKALLLARDAEIRDPAILEQFRA